MCFLRLQVVYIGSYYDTHFLCHFASCRVSLQSFHSLLFIAYIFQYNKLTWQFCYSFSILIGYQNNINTLYFISLKINEKSFFFSRSSSSSLHCKMVSELQLPLHSELFSFLSSPRLVVDKTTTTTLIVFRQSAQLLHPPSKIHYRRPWILQTIFLTQRRSSRNGSRLSCSHRP